MTGHATKSRAVSVRIDLEKEPQMNMAELITEANASIVDHHERGHFTADEAIARLTANGLLLAEALKLLGFDPNCDAALVPLGVGEVEKCVQLARHDGMHRTERGTQWIDFARDED